MHHTQGDTPQNTAWDRFHATSRDRQKTPGEGLRIGEAIKLDRGDVDWAQGVLLIRESKFGKSRLVPLHPSCVQALAGYAQLRDQLQPEAAEPAFFTSLNRKRLLYAVVQLTFRQLIDDAGIGADAPWPPRLHDLRH